MKKVAKRDQSGFRVLLGVTFHNSVRPVVKCRSTLCSRHRGLPPWYRLRGAGKSGNAYGHVVTSQCTEEAFRHRADGHMARGQGVRDFGWPVSQGRCTMTNEVTK
jgi:hypothetical protein